MTSTTSQQQSQSQKIIIHRLIKEANSHGPYLWSGADIENALLWFPRSTTSAKQQQQQQYEHADREKNFEEGTADLVEGGKLSNETSLPTSAASTKQQEEEVKGNEFLRLLLHSRGIWNPRPFKKKKKKKRSPVATNNNTTATTNNNHNTLAHPDNMNAINKRKRKRKRIDSSNTNEGDNNSNNTNRNNQGGRRKQPGATSTTEVMTSSPLQSVLMGYYQLLVAHPTVEVTLSNESLLDENNNNKDEEDNDVIATTKTAAVGAEAALEASTKLYNDLTTIISSRQYTLDIYQASISSLSSQQQQEEEPPPRRRQKEKHKVVVNMSIKIDQYMIHPTTCARRVYASSVYDRLLLLARNTDTTSANNNSSNNNNSSSNNNEEQQVVTRSSSSKEVQKFLQKLFGLATSSSSVAAVKEGGGEKNDEKIQEVILLVVLEPWRRLQVLQRQRQQLKRKRKESEENQNMQVTDCLDVQLPNNNQQQQREEEDLMELFPLLTSQSVSPTTLAVSTKHKPSQEKDVTDNESSTPLITLLVNSILHTNSDTWWSQPSPLLCTVSHYHFPIARKYIYHWVNRALVTHEYCYQDTTSSQELLFHHAVTRIQEFHRTSQRLGNLLVHFLDNMEEEIRMSSSSRLMMMEDGEEEGDDEESEVFHTSLALRAIRRAL